MLSSHGSAHNIDMGFFFGIERRNYCVNLVMWDYPGHCRDTQSTVVPSEKRVYEGISTVYQWLLDVNPISHETIPLFGRCIGTGPTVYLAEPRLKVRILGKIHFVVSVLLVTIDCLIGSNRDMYPPYLIPIRKLLETCYRHSFFAVYTISFEQSERLISKTTFLS